MLPINTASASAMDGLRKGRLGSIGTNCDSKRAVDELALREPTLSDNASPHETARLAQSLERDIGLFGTDKAYASLSLGSSQWLVRVPPPVLPETSYSIEQFG